MKIKQMIVSLMAVILLSGAASASVGVDAKVNAIYDRMSAAYLKLDEKLLESVYAQNGAYMRSNKDAALLKGREAIVASFAPWYHELRKDNAKISIEFRVIDRKHAKDMVTDIGYYKLTLKSPKESKRESRQFFGKFIITAIPEENGEWIFYNDLGTGSTQAAYLGAKETRNWKYAP